MRQIFQHKWHDSNKKIGFYLTVICLFALSIVDNTYLIVKVANLVALLATVIIVEADRDIK